MIYFDNASTTQVKEEVCMSMVPHLTKQFYNPSSSYQVGYEVSEELLKARKSIADTIGSLPEEIYFTSCGSESDNWAIKGTVLAANKPGKPHIITSQIEHHAVLNTCKQLEELGLATVTYLPVDKYGYINIENLKNSINSNTVIVSIMTVNNEIGTVQEILDIANICHKYGILFHTDAVQAYGKIHFNMTNNEVDLMSVSGHKFGAPKGIGFLYIRKGTLIRPLINGGQQEFGLRAGTENVPYIIGLAKACEIATRNLNDNVDKEKEYRKAFMSAIMEKYPLVEFNGISTTNIININFSAYNIRAEEIVAFMDEVGIQISSGSACNSQSNEPSHVLKALGLSDDQANSSIRISFNEKNTEQDMEFFIQALDLMLGGRI